MSQQVSSLPTLKSSNARSGQLMPAPVYLLLCGTLILCYALHFNAVRYVVTLTTLAVVYHLLDRLLARRVPACARLGPALDRCVLTIACLVPLISNPFLPLLLLAGVHPPTAAIPRPFLHLPLLSRGTLIEVVAIALCIALTVSSSLLSWQVRKRRVVSGTYGRPWLLFVGGLQLFWGNGLLMFSLYPVVRLPLWSFLSLTLIIAAIAVELRRFSTRWSNPLEALALCGLTFTLMLSMYQSTLIWMLLLFFAAITYIFVVYQRIPSGIFIPFTLAMFSLPPLLSDSRFDVVGLLCLLLPALGICLRLLFFNRWTKRSGVSEPIWEWPLLSFGIICTIIVSLTDTYMAVMYGHNTAFFSNTIANLTHLSIPLALELAMFSLFWYTISIVVRSKPFLTIATVLALFAVLALQPLPHAFRLSVLVTVIATLLAPIVAARTSRNWSYPLYGISVLGIIIQLNYFTTSALLIAALVQSFAAIVWLIEGYARDKYIFIYMALTVITLILLRGLTYPPLIVLALVLGFVAILGRIFGRRRLQII